MSTYSQPPTPDVVPTYLRPLRDWFANEQEVRCWFTDTSSPMGLRETTLPYAAFTAIHPDLPEAMRNQSDYHQRQYAAVALPQMLLWAQVQQLTEPRAVQDLRSQTQWLQEIAQVTWNQENHTVSLAADVMGLLTLLPYVHTKKVYAERVTTKPFVTSIRRQTVHVAESEMDHQFPDWQKRYAVADTLALSEREFARFVCPIGTRCTAETTPLPSELELTQ